jgi:hypothetical protein
MITVGEFPYTARPPLGALPYSRFFQAVKAQGSTERDSVDNASLHDASGGGIL